jgi:hypothetical protein
MRPLSGGPSSILNAVADDEKNVVVDDDEDDFDVCTGSSDSATGFWMFCVLRHDSAGLTNSSRMRYRRDAI